MTTQQKQIAFIRLIQSIGEVLRENKQTQRGTLYSSLLGQGCSLEQYERIENIFIESGRVKKVNHLLIWQD
jgi:hypothetical protein